MPTTIGSGLGGSVIAAPQNTWGGTPNFSSARTLPVKSAKPTWNPHPLQGGPYLRYGNFIDIGTARILLYQSATMTIVGDIMNTGQALLLASALGTSSTLSEIGTTTAYELGGISGANIGDPGANLTFIDLQQNVPTTDATVHTYTYHSGYVTKAEWTFDRMQLVGYSYDVLFQYVENTTALTAPVEAGGPIPFGMGGTNPIFKMGTYGSEATVDGVKKVVVALERKVTSDRIYVGEQYIDVPVMNDNAKLTVSLDWDNTPNANSSIAPLLLAGTPTSIVVGALGPAIGSGGYLNTFQLNATNCFLDTGGEQGLDGPDIVKNTASFSGKIDAGGDTALKAVLITPDTTF